MCTNHSYNQLWYSRLVLKKLQFFDLIILSVLTMSSRCMSLLETFCPGLSNIPKHLREGHEAKTNHNHQTPLYRSPDVCLEKAATWFGPSMYNLTFAAKNAWCKPCPLGAIKKPLTLSEKFYHKQSLMTLFWLFKDVHHTEHLRTEAVCSKREGRRKEKRRQLLHWNHNEAMWFMFPLSN